jgi:hypothetical protein
MLLKRCIWLRSKQVAKVTLRHPSRLQRLVQVSCQVLHQLPARRRCSPLQRKDHTDSRRAALWTEVRTEQRSFLPASLIIHHCKRCILIVVYLFSCRATSVLRFGRARRWARLHAAERESKLRCAHYCAIKLSHSRAFGKQVDGGIQYAVPARLNNDRDSAIS